MTFDEAVQHIKEERVRQDEQWGGHTHDINHSDFEWCKYIEKQMDYAVDTVYEGEFANRMIKIAALAIAALEARI